MALPAGWSKAPTYGLIIDGDWYPDFTHGDKINQTGMRAYLCDKRTQLLTGPRFSTKSMTTCHKLVKHGAKDVPNARVLMFAKTMKTAIKGGIWSDLVELTIPNWIRAGLGIKWEVEPKVDGATRMHYCAIRNVHGGISEYQMSSLEYEPDIEAILKGKRYSGIYFSELDTFRDRIVFDISQGQLRHQLPDGSALPYDKHLWLADTNPADEGEDSWIYKLFWDERLAEEPPASLKSKRDIDAWQKKKEHMAVHEFTLDDNVWWDEDRKSAEISPFIGTDLYERYVNGSWKASSLKGVFANSFNPQIHIIGNALPETDPGAEYLMPSDECVELVTGWDLGTSANHSAHICDVVQPSLFVPPTFLFIDELVNIENRLTIEEFTKEFVQLMDFWEDYFRQKFNRQVRWRHWSDNSAFVFRSTAKRAEAFDHLIVLNASGGRIQLRAAPKWKGSVRQRLEVAAKAMREDRLFVSTKCPSLAEAFKKAQRGDTKAEPMKKSRHSHPVDSSTYIVISESADAVAEQAVGATPRAGSGIVTTT